MGHVFKSISIINGEFKQQPTTCLMLLKFKCLLTPLAQAGAKCAASSFAETVPKFVCVAWLH